MSKEVDTIKGKILKEVFSDDFINDIRDEKDKEIERLTKQNKALNEMYELTKKEYIRLNNIIEDIDTYIHLWNLDDIGEKTMLILNDILLIKNGMRNEVVRLGSDKE